MIDRQELETRLVGWAQEYGGGRYEHVGWHSRNLLQTLVEHQGFVPSSRGFVPIPIRSAADLVEKTVCEMEAGDMCRHAKVLRCDYFAPNLTVEERLRAMRRGGYGMSRAGYYDLLAQAKCFVRAALSNQVVPGERVA